VKPYSQIRKNKKRQALSVVAASRQPAHPGHPGNNENFISLGEAVQKISPGAPDYYRDVQKEDRGELYGPEAVTIWPLSELTRNIKNAGAQDSAGFFWPGSRATDAGPILSRSLSLISESPSARHMLQEACAQGWKAGLADLRGPDFTIDVPGRTVLLDNNGLTCESLSGSVYFMNMLLFSLIRALRDIWQEKRHGGFDEEHGPEAVLMLERVRAADCDVMTVFAAWELRGAGQGDLWRHVIGSEEGDLAMIFSDYLERHPAGHFTNAALAVTFRRWFAVPERVNACDHETLDYLDSVLCGYDGRNPFGDARARARKIEVLSCLPDKTAYLQGRGEEILADPHYAGLADTINQTHLMQILHDSRVIYAGDIGFQDEGLARKFSPAPPAEREESLTQ